MSLRDFVVSGVTMETDNWQVRSLAGDHNATPFGQCDRSMLDRAKDNIARDFRLVGLSERFDESVIVLTRLMGWRLPYYTSLNRAPEHTPDVDLSPRDASAIEPHVTLDQELYGYVQQCFDRQLSEVDDIQSELVHLRRRNSLYGPLGSGVPRLRRRVATGPVGRLLGRRS